MATRMLIDASHPEETRVAVISGNRLEEFDYESSTKKTLKGNVYLAKIIRVEPSLQAAFVDFGGNRHGFLAFNEIHPDYYRIPIADREALLAEEAKQAQQADDAILLDDEDESETKELNSRGDEPEGDEIPDEPSGSGEPEGSNGNDENARPPAADEKTPADESGENSPAAMALYSNLAVEVAADLLAEEKEEKPDLPEDKNTKSTDKDEDKATADATADATAKAGEESSSEPSGEENKEEKREENEPADNVEQPQSGAKAPVRESRPRRSSSTRRYKIQEVIKRNQIVLVQVAKEERGTKGAALTTRLSLAGRYCVLMPNTARGGGISRKISLLADRKKLKTIVDSLDIPQGMAVIVRTAGLARTKAEIKRDYEYLLRLWNDIRELTMKSSAPALINEEGNIIKRAIRDLYTREMEEVLVDSDDAYRAAKAAMRMLMPSHAKRVQQYKETDIPLFQRYQVESQIDAIHNPTVHLKSGGYLVMNQTEALVAIDVNSGRSTRERNIEETATKTNLEASDEIGRQLRLRDLAGLVVIDFIDMDERRNQNKVEKRLKEALKHDRARIQVGRISTFGLLEMSRQRLRPSLGEFSTRQCPYCEGTGQIRSIESTALHVLRAIEEEGIRKRSTTLNVFVQSDIALYILNQKRATLEEIQTRHGITVFISRDDTLIPPDYRMEGDKGTLAKEPAETGDRDRGKSSRAASPRRRGRSRQAVSEEAAPSKEAEAEAPEPEIKLRKRKARARRQRRGGAVENVAVVVVAAGQIPRPKPAGLKIPYPEAAPKPVGQRARKRHRPRRPRQKQMSIKPRRKRPLIPSRRRKSVPAAPVEPENPQIARNPQKLQNLLKPLKRQEKKRKNPARRRQDGPGKQKMMQKTSRRPKRLSPTEVRTRAPRRRAPRRRAPRARAGMMVMATNPRDGGSGWSNSPP